MDKGQHRAVAAPLFSVQESHPTGLSAGRDRASQPPGGSTLPAGAHAFPQSHFSGVTCSTGEVEEPSCLGFTA